MAPINKVRLAGFFFLLCVALLAGGCASYQAQQAFQKAEQLAAEENFDEAVNKYFEAASLDPSRKKYKLKLLSTRTRAANFHIKQARRLANNGEIPQALDQYRLARGFDPGIEVARQEEQVLRNILSARGLAEEGADFFAKRNLALAEKAIDKALQLDPNNARALALRDLIQSKQETVTMDGIELDVASSEPITLSFKDAKIKEVFDILSELSGINFIFDEDIRSQSISVLLEKASFAQAMELIMQMNGLGKKILNSKTIIIYPQSREKEKQYEDQLIQTFYLSHIDAKKAVNMLRTMLQLRKVYVHEERNALVIRDKPDVIRLAEKILDAADRENSEVIFNLELLAVSKTDDLNIGPSLSSYSVSAGFANQGGATIVSENLGAGSSTDNLVSGASGLETFYTLPTVTFDLAKSLTDTEVLASPKIRVRNKEKAKVHIGTREPIVTVTTTGDTSTDNIQYVDVGVKVDVEPTIQLDNSVETKLTLEVSQVIDRFETSNGSVALTISTTTAQSTLTLKDGVQTILGGLFEQNTNNTVTTVPVLGDIPLIGKLFSGISDEDRKREILLSITPYIVKQVEVPEYEVATIWSGGEDNLKLGPNFGAFAEPLRSEVEATRPLAAPAVKPVEIPLPGQSLEQPAPATPDGDAESTGSDAPADPEMTADETRRPEEPAPERAPASSAESAAADLPVDGPETVPTETMTVKEEIGPPIVLDMPEKGPAVISFAGPEEVDQGEEFSMAVQVNEVENLYSAPLFVRYDPAVLELVSINEGDFLKQDGQTTVFSSSPNRTTGQVIVGYKQGAGGQGASGSGTLFNLVFRPIAAGETRLEVNRINFRDPEGVRLQVVPEAVMIKVR